MNLTGGHNGSIISVSRTSLKIKVICSSEILVTVYQTTAVVAWETAMQFFTTRKPWNLHKKESRKLHLSSGIQKCTLHRFSFNLEQYFNVTADHNGRAVTEINCLGRSDAGIVGSNHTWGMDVCVRLFCVCAVLYAGSGLTTGRSPIQGVLPIVQIIKKLK
jgi:hypothetical protein